MVQTLETDADEAEKFVNQLKNGQVPSIFQDLPDEAVLEFRNFLNIALSLPNRDPRCRRGRGRPMPPRCSTTSKTAAIIQDIEFDPRYRPVRHHERMGGLSPTSLPVPGTTRPAVSDVSLKFLKIAPSLLPSDLDLLLRLRQRRPRTEPQQRHRIQ